MRCSLILSKPDHFSIVSRVIFHKFEHFPIVCGAIFRIRRQGAKWQNRRLSQEIDLNMVEGFSHGAKIVLYGIYIASNNIRHNYVHLQNWSI